MVNLKSVYLLGAGVNQVVKDWDNLSPPLLSNFFNIALKKRKFSDEHYLDQMKDVFEYIESLFKKDIENLKQEPFDLEMCFTILEKQAIQAEQKGMEREYNNLMMIYFKMKSFLAEVLSEFEHFAISSSSFRNFGKVIFYENPAIITFNYDCLLEHIIKLTSKVNLNIPESFRTFVPRMQPFKEEELPDDLLVYSHSNWNAPLGYGFKFDEIRLEQAGISPFVSGKRFYSLPENELYSKPLLKLHGSLNWFRYLPFRMIPTFPGDREPSLGEKESHILLTRGTWWFGRPPHHEGWLLDPLIITPTLYKDEYHNKKPFRDIWEMAKIYLSKCEKLVVIGYSFSPTDFSTKQLLLESFIENNLKELVVVNPNYDLVKVVKDLCHFKGGVFWFSNLDEYIESFSKVIHLESKPIKMEELDLPKDTSPHDVYLKCKTCGIEFKGGIRTNPRSHATSQFFGFISNCPNGHSNSYDKEDFILKKVNQDE